MGEPFALPTDNEIVCFISPTQQSIVEETTVSYTTFSNCIMKMSCIESRITLWSFLGIFFPKADRKHESYESMHSYAVVNERRHISFDDRKIRWIGTKMMNFNNRKIHACHFQFVCFRYNAPCCVHNTHSSYYSSHVTKRYIHIVTSNSFRVLRLLDSNFKRDRIEERAASQQSASIFRKCSPLCIVRYGS